MGFDATKIHLGTARLFVGVTAPATGTPPTYLVHTDGVPGTGTEVGLTESDTVFHAGNELLLIEADQALAPVDVGTVKQMMRLECTVKEQTFNTLKQVWDNVGSDSQASGDALYMGGGTSILAPRTSCVVATARQRNAPTKFIVAVLYKAAQTTPFQMPFSQRKESTYKLTFVALQDLTRNAGDQIGYYRFEK